MKRFDRTFYRTGAIASGYAPFNNNHKPALQAGSSRNSPRKPCPSRRFRITDAVCSTRRKQPRSVFQLKEGSANNVFVVICMGLMVKPIVHVERPQTLCSRKFACWECLRESQEFSWSFTLERPMISPRSSLDGPIPFHISGLIRAWF